VATVEVGMATWKAINSLQFTREPSIQASTPFNSHGNLVFRLGLIRPLGRNGVT